MHRKRLFRPFWNLDYLGIPDLSQTGDPMDLDGLLPDRGHGRLLLGRYDVDAIRERFDHYGVAQRLAELGYADYDVEFNANDVEQQEMKVWPRTGGRRGAEPLCEMVLRDVMARPDSRLMPDTRRFRLLVIQWLRLQDPNGSLPVERLLPGQKYPGLGLGRKVMEMFVALARLQGFEGLVNRPEFLHNAWLYSPHFRYLDPVAEGRLAALKRDLGSGRLWTVAWAAQKGLILEDGCRTFFRWYQGEQIFPNCPELKALFASSAYLEAVDEACRAARYAFVEGCEGRLAPKVEA